MISGQLSTEMRHPAFHLRPTRRDPRCPLPSRASAQYASFNDSTNRHRFSDWPLHKSTPVAGTPVRTRSLSVTCP